MRFALLLSYQLPKTLVDGRQGKQSFFEKAKRLLVPGYSLRGESATAE